MSININRKAPVTAPDRVGILYSDVNLRPGDLDIQKSALVCSLVAQTVKRLLTTQETRVQSLGREDLLEKEMATHSSILAWKIPWMEEPGRLQPMGSQRVRHD